MTRGDLAALTDRIVPIQAARAERHRHRRRGGERLSGGRGGIFTGRITDAERVLATVLHQRGLGTHDTLAELFEVNRTIGGVLREVGPLLAQQGDLPVPAMTCFRQRGRAAGFPHRSASTHQHADTLILHKPTTRRT
jgi:hypothetical protein